MYSQIYSLYYRNVMDTVAWHLLRFVFFIFIIIPFSFFHVYDFSNFLLILLKISFLYQNDFFRSANACIPKFYFRETLFSFTYGHRSRTPFMYIFSFSFVFFSFSFSSSFFFSFFIIIFFYLLFFLLIKKKIVTNRVLCKGTKHLHTFMNSITEWKGEGAIFRLCNSLYENGRANALLKLKACFK